MEDETLTPLDPNHVTALRLGALALAVPLLVVAAVWEVLRMLPLPGLALVPALALLVWFVIRFPLRRYANKGFAMGADRLRIVRGLLWRRDTVVPFGRVQHIDVERNPIDRHYGLSTLVLHTAGTHNATIRLSGLAEAEALAMREAIRDKIRRDTL